MPKTPPHIATLILLAALSLASLNMFVPSLPNMARDFGASYGVMNLALSLSLAVAAIVHLITGPLSDRLGRRPVLLGGLGIFVIGSVGCSLAQDVNTFLLFRVLQGSIAAAGSVSMAVVRDTHAGRDAAARLAHIAMAMSLAPLLGPMLGGFMDAAFGWRSIFYFYTLFGGAMLVVSFLDLGETKSGEAANQSSRLRPTELLKLPLYWAYVACMAFSVGAFFVFISGVPLVAETEFGIPASGVGIFVGSVSAGFMLGSFITSRLAKHTEAYQLMIAGRIITFLGLSFGLLVVALDVHTAILFFGSTIFIGIGNGLTMPNANAGAMSIRPELAGTAAGVSAATLVAVGAILTSVTGPVLMDGNAPLRHMALLIVTAAVALFAALAVWRLQQKTPR